MELVEGIVFVWEKADGDYNYYNLGSTSTITVARIVEAMIEELGLSETTKINYTGGDRGWVGDVPRFEYNLKKVNALGWNAELDSEEAIRLTVRHLRKEIGL